LECHDILFARARIVRGAIAAARDRACPPLSRLGDNHLSCCPSGTGGRMIPTQRRASAQLSLLQDNVIL
jgi:hypothetical protein